MKGKEIEKTPFVNLSEKKAPYRMYREKIAEVRWLQPRIVGEIAFNERTQARAFASLEVFRLRGVCGSSQKKEDKDETKQTAFNPRDGLVIDGGQTVQ